MLPTGSTNLQKRKRSAISVNIKKEICEYMVANTCVKHLAVASFFNTKYNLDIDRTTITKIWGKREKWLAVLPSLQTSKTFKQRLAQFPLLDKAMQIWTSQAVTAEIPLTDMILQQKGLEFVKKLNIENKVKYTNR